MAATYRKVPRSVPSDQRNMVITDVVGGDEIDVVDILGRPARQIKIVPDDTSDSIEIRLNNRIRIPTLWNNPAVGGVHETPEPVYVVSHSEVYPAYTLTGASEYYTEDRLAVSYITIEDITFGSGGTSIDIYIW